MSAPLSLVATLLLVAVLGTGCETAGARYPGRADVEAGDPPVVWIDTTGTSDANPRVLRVRAGTEVTWLNRTRSPVFIRFDQPIEEICAEPVRFGRSADGKSFASSFVLPFREARLCFATPGRYDFIASIARGAGGFPLGRLGDGPELPPAKYGTVIVEP